MSLVADIENALLKEGFNKRSFMDNLITFSKSDCKGRIVICISTNTECVNFMIKPEDPELDDTDINIGLHLFCRLLQESDDLNSFFKTIKQL
jgi:hypothetical protein